MRVYVVLDQTSDEEGDIFEAVFSTFEKAMELCIDFVKTRSGHYNISVDSDIVQVKNVDRYGTNYGRDIGYKNERFNDGVNWVATLIEYEVKE